MIPSLEGLPTKAKEAPSPHEVRLAPLDTNPEFHSLGVDIIIKWILSSLVQKIARLLIHSHRLVLNLADKINLKRDNTALSNFSI